jgi:hypothetical protein
VKRWLRNAPSVAVKCGRKTWERDIIRMNSNALTAGIKQKAKILAAGQKVARYRWSRRRKERN